MRLVTFIDPDSSALRTGVELPEGIVVDLAATDASVPTSMLDLLAGGPALLDHVRRLADNPTSVQVFSPAFAAPVPRPGKVVCIGLNYRDHAAESQSPIPEEPVVFNKFPSVVIGPGMPIMLPHAESQQIDYEAELVVVIGQRAHRVTEAEALAHVAGYTIGNDVTARDWQRLKAGKQWLLGKSFDTFAPMGPAIVTTDEIPDPGKLSIELRLDGTVMQSSTTDQMIFSVAQIVAYVSRVAALEPGDVIFTGTPAGVGFARNPPVWLESGQQIEVTIDQIGTLSNMAI